MLRNVALARLLAAALALLAIAAPAHARDRLVVGLQLEPPGLDPTSGAAAPTDDVTYHTVFEGLTRLDARGRAQPLLATGWTMAPDARAYVFTLRPGVRFHDGTRFDAAAAAFSLERIGAPRSTNALKARLADIAGIDVLGPLALRIRLSSPDAELPELLAWGDAAMVSPRGASRLATDPVGTGPFRFAGWARGRSVTLARNADYWGAPPPLAAVEFRFVADPAAAAAAMRVHTIDLFTAFPAPESLTQLARDPRLKISTGPSEAEVILALNNARAPLDDLRVRRAISHALDRRAIIDGAMAGHGAPIGSHMPPQDPDYVDLTGRYPHDPAKARRLLAEAGVPHPALTLTLPPPSYARRAGEIAAAQLRAVGVAVMIVPVDWPQWLDQVFARHAFDMSIVAHVEPRDYAIYGRADYYFGYRGAAGVRALLDRLRATADPGRRHVLLATIQQRIADDAVNGFLFLYPRLSVADAGLRDLWDDTPLSAVDYARARFADGAAEDARAAGARPPWGAIAIGGAIVLALLLGRSLGPRWLAARALVLALTLLGASLAIFALLQLAPGDPAQYIAGLEARPEGVAALRAELGLEGSAPQRYLRWARGLLSGDFGTSATYRVPVAGLIAGRLAVSAPLALLAAALALALGLGGALATAGSRATGRIGAALAGLGIALPSFLIAVLLLAIAGGGGIGLAALALGLPQAGIVYRVARATLRGEQGRDYVRFARAKGLGQGAVLIGHVLPNALPPVIALMGLQMPYLLGGAVIVENVFLLPGLGQLVVQAIAARDLIVVQAVAMLLVAVTVGCGFLADVGQAAADPRLRRAR